MNFLHSITLEWVVSTVFVGIALNLLCSYLKEGIDKLLFRNARWRENVLNRRAEKWRSLVVELATSESTQYKYRMQRAVDASQAAMNTVVGLLSSITGCTGSVIATQIPVDSAQHLIRIAVAGSTFFGGVFLLMALQYIRAWRKKTDLLLAAEHVELAVKSEDRR